MSSSTTTSLSPSTLLAILQPWTDVAEPIHERIAQLAEVGGDSETLWVGCGSGRSVVWWAERFGTQVEGVDPDEPAIEDAERVARTAAPAARATFQAASAENLPHEAAVFDITVVNLLYLADADGAAVFAQAGRVARPMSTVIALVPSWLSRPSKVDAQRVEQLGIKPQLLVEWKSFMRDAGLVELTVENAAKDGGWIAHGWFGLLARGWRVARWRGLRVVLGSRLRTLRRLALTRVLGLSIVKGTRWPHG
jgi:SAM-dependent methyltransferase